MIQLFGLKSCDTCKKALKWLDRNQIAHQFIDYREHPIPGETLKAWAKQIGWPALVNRQSTTWRQLPDARKLADSDAEFVVLLRDHPALIKRPVLLIEGRVQVGFSDPAWKKLLLAAN